MFYVVVSIDIDMDFNFPYDLASLFSKIMKESHANTNMVIENLINAMRLSLIRFSDT